MDRLYEVGEDRFFAYVGPRDIVLRTEAEETVWETRNRTVVGKSTPGYRNSRPDGKKTYFLTPDAFEDSRG